MKKRQGKKTGSNVILFPNLDQRFLEKGLEYLQDKKYQPAVGLFEEALTLSPDNRDVYIGLLLAYYESGMYEKAKLVGKEMLRRGIGEYFDTVELYLMVLVQLHEYEEIATTIDALLDEKEIPREKIDHFTKLLDFARRRKDENWEDDYGVSAPESEERQESLGLLDNQNENKLILIIAELANKNTRLYIDEIKTYLSQPEGHPFLKTMLLSILKEQEYEKEIVVNKFKRERTVIPAQLFDMNENMQKLEIERELQNKLESENPVLYEQIRGLLERQMFLLYPFDFLPTNASLWAGAYHAAGIEFSGGEMDMEEIARLYQTDEVKTRDACLFIKELEEISYPII